MAKADSPPVSVSFLKVTSLENTKGRQRSSEGCVVFCVCNAFQTYVKEKRKIFDKGAGIKLKYPFREN